jgi:formamidopyrimidine-DNA glycosylase
MKQKIIGITLHWQKSVDAKSADLFCQRLLQQEFLAVTRRAKFIILTLSSGEYLLVHLRMSGKLLIIPSGEPLQEHDRIVFNLENSLELRFRDPRKFGRCYITNDLVSFFSNYGPEPLAEEFTLSIFEERLKKRSGKIKSLLLDQQFIAGLGNIYVDESLWTARIHPERTVNSLSEEEIKELYHAIRKVLNCGIEHRGTSIGRAKPNFYSIQQDYGLNQAHLAVYKRAKLPCPRCHTLIIRYVMAQRGTHICTKCQVAPLS